MSIQSSDIGENMAIQLEEDYNVQGNCVQIFWQAARPEARKGWRLYAVVKTPHDAVTMVEKLDAESPGTWMFRVQTQHIPNIGF
jgi:hypothetical protein